MLVCLLESRVRVHGVRGYAPPPTTKLAVFYPGGFEAQLLLNATGYGSDKKWDLIERQLRHFIPKESIDKIETLEFQRYLSLLFQLEPVLTEYLESVFLPRTLVHSDKARHTYGSLLLQSRPMPFSLSQEQCKKFLSNISRVRTNICYSNIHTPS